MNAEEGIARTVLPIVDIVDNVRVFAAAFSRKVAGNRGALFVKSRHTATHDITGIVHTSGESGAHNRCHVEAEPLHKGDTRRTL